MPQDTPDSATQADGRPRDDEDIRDTTIRNLKETIEHLKCENRKLAVANPPPITAERLGEAMQAVWDDHCGDAGSIPECIKIHGPRTTMVSGHFKDSSFAERVAEYLAVKFPG